MSNNGQDLLLNNLLNIKHQVTQIAENQTKATLEKQTRQQNKLFNQSNQYHTIYKFISTNKYLSFSIISLFVYNIVLIVIKPQFIMKTVPLDGSTIFTKDVINLTTMILANVLYILLFVSIYVAYYFLKSR